MPTVTVAFWNIQDFGATPSTKQNYVALTGFVANAVQAADVDVLFIQELKAPAIGFGHLATLQSALNALPAPRNNWHFEFVKGSLATAGVAPWATAADLDWDVAHHEGYAVFWNQNLAKFRMQAAPPVQRPATPPGIAPAVGAGPVVPCTQSQTVRTYGTIVIVGVATPIYGVAVPGGGTVVPPNPAYTVPAGTVPGAGGFTDAAGAVHAAGAATAAATAVNAGTVLPAGTTVGAAGVTLTSLYLLRNPVVVPGAFVLTDPLTLPPVGTVVVPEHALSLVLVGRDTTGGAAGMAYPTGVGDYSGQTQPFAPGGGTNWWYLTFPRGPGFPLAMAGPRRPAFVTIELNLNAAPNPANQLVPIVCYHAPSAGVASTTGMQRAAYSRPMYQAYDHVAAAWIDNARAVLGGDMNVVIDGVMYPYLSFTNALAAPLAAAGGAGAGCQIRVANPAPFAAPQAAPPPPPPPPPAAGYDRSHNTLNKTTVQLRTAIVGGAQIINASPNFYRSLAIDNAFYRGFNAVTAPMPVPADVFDLVTALTGPAPAVPQAVVQAFEANLPFLHAARLWYLGLVPPPMPPAPTLADITNLPWFAHCAGLWGVMQPPIAAPVAVPVPSARQAAELYRRFVSDHLPVLFRMQL